MLSGVRDADMIAGYPVNLAHYILSFSAGATAMRVIGRHLLPPRAYAKCIIPRLQPRHTPN